ncbi:MAG: DUF429 domain-containing protein [Nitrososphaeria archaeon]|nr:DUF429 domain-containing protein [Nitrososphaeria archaeon]
MHVVGLDLSGSTKRGSGICLIHNCNVKTFVLYSDKEILEKIISSNARVIAVDAPLSLPKGRKSLDDKNGPHLRECDKELLRRKIKFFPLTLGAMRKLTERGIRLKELLKEKGYEVIEVYPGGAQDIWKFPRKNKNLEELRKNLESIGLKGDFEKMGHDELDAVTAALVGILYLLGGHDEYGDRSEGTIIMPKNGSLEILKTYFKT